MRHSLEDRCCSYEVVIIPFNILLGILNVRSKQLPKFHRGNTSGTHVKDSNQRTKGQRHTWHMKQPQRTS
jgi:hypothetical protein